MNNKLSPLTKRKLEIKQALSTLLIGGIVLSSLYVLNQLDADDGMEHCDTCTQTIDGNSSSTITLSGGEVLCITKTGNFTGTLNRWNGTSQVTIVNEGTFNPAQVNFNKGNIRFENYNQAAPQQLNILKNSSTLVYNQAGASLTPQAMSLRGNQCVLHNYGNFTPGTLYISGNASLYNYENASVLLKSLEVNGGYLSNEGDMQLTPGGLTLNNASQFDNFLDLVANGDVQLNGNSQWQNFGKAQLDNNLVVNNATLTNDSTITIANDFTLNSGGQVDLTGRMEIGNNLTLNKLIAGPTTGQTYAVITIEGLTTINGGGSITGKVDFCDAGYPANGADFIYGSIGPDVSFCVNHLTSNINFPIELMSFEAKLANDRVELVWQTSQEINNHFFEIERSGEDHQFAAIGRVDGAGNSHDVQSYNFYDQPLSTGRSYYRLKQVDYDGEFSYSPVVEVEIEAPSQFELVLSPNPASTQTNMSIRSSKNQQVELQILTLDGKMKQGISAQLSPGTTQVPFSLYDFESGVYLVMVMDHTGRRIAPIQRLIKE